MNTVSKTDHIVLIIGDICVLLLALWLTLTLRFQDLPSLQDFYAHLKPFSFIFLASLVVYFIAGLYEKHTIGFQKRLAGTIATTQIINSAIATLFFYFVSIFGIAPKTILVIYIVVSYFLFLVWRKYLFISLSTREKQNAILLGSGYEIQELYTEVNENPRYNIRFVALLDLNRSPEELRDEIYHLIKTQNIDSIVLDLKHDKINSSLSELYNLIFSQVRFVDMNKLYEDIFDRIPLSLVRHNWFLENISTSPKVLYDGLKRIMDIGISLVLGAFALILFPLVYLAIKLDDDGPILIAQNRIGKNDRPIKIYKYRSMTTDDAGQEGTLKKENKLTRIGPFLRKSRIDELPQLWNVLKGDLSLIGPRPELPVLVDVYEKEIPYYKVRHLIKPGLSGWAQLYHKDPPKRNADYDKTRGKLSYDLYYIKNRSLLLDLKIGLKTLKMFISGI